MSVKAPVKWAQRKDRVYLVIDVQDLKEEKIELLDTQLSFIGTASGQKYTVDITFFDEIDPKVGCWD